MTYKWREPSIIDDFEAWFIHARFNHDTKWRDAMVEKFRKRMMDKLEMEMLCRI